MSKITLNTYGKYRANQQGTGLNLSSKKRIMKEVSIIVFALFVLLGFSLPNGVQSAKYVISSIHYDERNQEAIKPQTKDKMKNKISDLSPKNCTVLN